MLSFNSIKTIFCRNNIKIPLRAFSKQIDPELKIQENPFFGKYADKIAAVQRSSSEEFHKLLQKNLQEIQGTSFKTCKTHSQPKVSEMKNSFSVQKKDLNQIMKIEMVENKSAEEIEFIWKKFHQEKDGLYATLPASSFDKMSSNFRNFPIFLLPLPRAEGYEFFVCQFWDQSCYLTPLLSYQAFNENAPVCLTNTYFAEFKDKKGMVLMKGEYDSNLLKPHEAQCLINQVQLYYGSEDKEKLQLLYDFNRSPSSFKHMDLISNFEQNLGK